MADNNHEVYCPACDYTMPIRKIVGAKHDYECPRCGITKLSEYVNTRMARFSVNPEHFTPDDGEAVLVDNGNQAVYLDGKYRSAATWKELHPAVWRPLSPVFRARVIESVKGLDER